jgi:hypothetical protein
MACYRESFPPFFYPVRISAREETIMTVKSTIFWNVVLCTPVKVRRRFGDILPLSSGSKNEPSEQLARSKPDWLKFTLSDGATRRICNSLTHTHTLNLQRFEPNIVLNKKLDEWRTTTLTRSDKTKFQIEMWRKMLFGSPVNTFNFVNSASSHVCTYLLIRLFIYYGLSFVSQYWNNTKCTVAHRHVAQQWVCKQWPLLLNGSINTFPLLGSRFLIMQHMDHNNRRSAFSMWSGAEML